MRGLMVPDLVEDLTADPVELFFDLALVVEHLRIEGPSASSVDDGRVVDDAAQ